DSAGTTLGEGRDDASDFAGSTLGEGRDDASDSAGTTLREGRDAGSTRAMLAETGVEILAMGEGRVDLAAAMRTLRGLGMERVLVEGGGTLNFELFRLGLVDEVHVYVAPTTCGGRTAPT